jgi:cleavage stimulation factor subunit 3
LGDVANARALFERALTATPTASAAPLWDAYLRFEHQVGTLAAAAAVEQRRRDALAGAGGEGPGALDAAHLAAVKYRYLDLWPGYEAHFRSLLLGEAPPGGESEGGGAATVAPAPVAAPRERERERERPTRRETRRRERSRSRSPAPRGGGGGGGGGGAEPIRQFPRELGLLLNQLPRAPDGPIPDVEKVVDVIVRADFSIEGIEAHEAAAARERRRQRHAAERGAAGAPGGGPPGGPGGFPPKRKAPMGVPGMGGDDSDSDSSGGDDDGAGMDVYRRRMRARI